MAVTHIEHLMMMIIIIILIMHSDAECDDIDPDILSENVSQQFGNGIYIIVYK